MMADMTGIFEGASLNGYFSEGSRSAYNEENSRSAFNDENSRQSTWSDSDPDTPAARIKRLLAQAALDQQNPITNGPGSARDRAFPVPKLTSSQKEKLKRAEKFAMEQNIKTVLVKQTLSHQTQQMFTFQTSVQKQQALALMCRVYVGSINFEIREDTVRQAFTPFGPIRTCQLSWDPVLQKHKGFAFVEYEIPEAASLALEQMNNAMLGGRNIKCGRPSNMPQAMPLIDVVMQEASKYNRIYVASIHYDITDNDLQSVFEAFGKIISCKIAYDPTRSSRHRGYAFIEYDTKQACEDAIAAMNLFDLGGQFIRVGKAVTPPGMFMMAPVVQSTLPTASAVAAAAITAKITAMEAVKEVAAVVSSQPSSLPLPGIAVPSIGPPGIALPKAVGAPGVAIPIALGAPPTVVPIESLASSASVSLPPLPVTNLHMPNVPAQPVPVPLATSLPSLSVSLPPPGVANIGTTGFGGVPPVGISSSGSMTSFGGVPPPPPVPSPYSVPNANSFSAVFPDYVPAAASQTPYGQQPMPSFPVQVPTSSALNQVKLTDAQKRLMEDDQTMSLDQQEEMKISGSAARHLVMQKLMRLSENKVMVLRNMVDASEIDEDLEGEVTDECGKYGTVDRVIIYQERQGEEDDAEILVKIFVLFEKQSEMEAAVAALNGRFFGGRHVLAQAYDQALFDANDLSG